MATMPVSPESVLRALATVSDPVWGQPLTAPLVGLLKDVAVDGANVRIDLDSPVPTHPAAASLDEEIAHAVKGVGASNVRVNWTASPSSRAMASDDIVPAVKNLLLVMSGKGGVGKSTTASNLAVALTQLGAKVGLLDADMYGPSIPTMFGVSGAPGSDGERFIPLERFGIKLMSLGFMLENDKQAVIWRGPMLQSALLQLLKDVAWGELDYLVLDLPPGTGDIALTISQKLRTTGAIIVTTPQEVALQDVYKSVAMAHKVNIPILGVVENESYFMCDGCSKRHEIFGSGGGEKIAEFARAPLLAQIPLVPAVRELGDSGTPITEAQPKSALAAEYRAMAYRIAVRARQENQQAGALRIDRSGGEPNRHLPIAR